MSNEFLMPWVPADFRSTDLEAEFLKEVAIGHSLYGKQVKAIAQRIDNDDVLFEVFDSQHCFVVVHLTWTGQPEVDPQWPAMEGFKSFTDWLEKCMERDHREYLAGS